MSPAPARSQVVVVGAGLSGLRCASLLSTQGYEVVVLEASDGIGGRARTDEVDGFRLDRGFQVLLTSYPEAREAFDYDRLDLGSFEPGALVRDGGDFAPLTDPLRRPTAVISAAMSPVATIRDKARLARLRFELAGKDPGRIAAEPQVPTGLYLEQLGFSRAVVDNFFRPFFGGVLIDPDLETTSALFQLYFGYFSTGDAALPAGGMGALSAQLAERLPEGSIRLEVEVAEVGQGRVVLADGSAIEADAVVIATEENAAAGLLGRDLPTDSSTTTCLYFDAPADDVPDRLGRTLLLSGDDPGPINEVAVPSAVAEAYAPEGRDLISVSAVGREAMRGDLVSAVTDQLAEWFGSPAVDRWRLLGSYRIENALPAFPPGRFAPESTPAEVEPGLFRCGDYMESPSIQGSLVSGRRAAEAVAGSLAPRLKSGAAVG
jgi:phytoene dehydrogenase-like protein